MAGILVAIGFNVLDIITGIIAAIRNKDVVSQKLRDGLFKKCGFILCYLLAWMVDTYGGNVGITLPMILPVILAYAVYTEIVSIIENISKINVDLIPEVLKKMFGIGGKDDGKDVQA